MARCTPNHNPASLLRHNSQREGVAQIQNLANAGFGGGEMHIERQPLLGGLKFAIVRAMVLTSR